MFLYLLITINILGMEEIKVSYPKGRVDFSFYQNLEEDKYKGKYVDLFDFLNKDKKYKFKYQIEKKDEKNLLQYSRNIYSFIYNIGSIYFFSSKRKREI